MSVVKVLNWGTILYQCPSEVDRFYVELSDERGASYLIQMPTGLKDKLLTLSEKQAHCVLGGLLPTLPEPISHIFMERLAEFAGEEPSPRPTQQSA